MKKKRVLLVFFSILLSGCLGANQYNFSGKSENWQASYIVDVTNDNRKHATGSLKYIGNEPDPQEISYTLTANSSQSEVKGASLVNESVPLNSSCEGCAVIQPDEEIEIEVIWDGQIENLILVNE